MMVASGLGEREIESYYLMAQRFRFIGVMWMDGGDGCTTL